MWNVSHLRRAFEHANGEIRAIAAPTDTDVTVIIGAFVLLLNVICPETRRSPYRRTYTESVDEDEKVRRMVARGEVKLHLESEGPKWWGEEVWAGIKLNFMMLFQRGYFILALYTGWTFAQMILIIVVSQTCQDGNFLR